MDPKKRYRSGVIEMLECAAVVEYTRMMAPRLSKISLKMAEKEVERAFEGKAPFGSIIGDVSSICE